VQLFVFRRPCAAVSLGISWPLQAAEAEAVEAEAVEAEDDDVAGAFLRRRSTFSERRGSASRATLGLGLRIRVRVRVRPTLVLVKISK
jgi:hypothetical protein